MEPPLVILVVLVVVALTVARTLVRRRAREEADREPQVPTMTRVVAAAVLTASGFDASLGDAQPDSVDGGIRIMLAVVPLAFSALAFLCFWLYPIRTSDV